RYRLLKSKWITDGQNKISRLHHVRVSEFERLDARVVHLEHSQIDLRIRADQPRLLRLPITQLHLDLINLVAFSIGDHVTVCDDMAFVCYNHAGAGRVLHKGLVARTTKLPPVLEEKFERIKPVFPSDTDLL